MGNKARQNLRKKNAQAERQVHQKAVEKNLRLTLMNMRQLYNEETQKVLGLISQLDEARQMIAALALEYGEGSIEVSAEFLTRARLIDGIQVQPLDEKAGFSITVVEAPPEDDEAAVTAEFDEVPDEGNGAFEEDLVEGGM